MGLKAGQLNRKACLLELYVEASGLKRQIVLPCQPRVTVTPCFVYEVIRDFELIDHLCINPI